MKNKGSFAYTKTPYRFVAEFKDGHWGDGYLSEDDTITLSESACVFQYAQTCFEGMKAYKTKDGKIVLFRPDLNEKRMADSCRRMMMPVYPDFLKAVDMVVKANADLVPEYGSGASLYLRPFMIGTNAVLGVKPAEEFQFRIFASPVGAYFSTPVKPLKLRISDFDRAAPRGTGHIKAGLNYAMSLFPISDAHAKGFDENVYLDSSTRTYIEETGGANIVFVSKNGTLVVPRSDTILPSITRRSIITIAEELLHMKVVERRVTLSEIDKFEECFLCGTASVVSPVGEIHDDDIVYTFKTEEDGFGKVTGTLRKLLTDIQYCNTQGPDGWVHPVE